MADSSLITSFVEGAIAGYGIAIPVGAIAVLIVDMALRQGFRAGFMAGAGAASADLIYAALAAVAGPVLTGLLAPWATLLRLVSGVILVAIGVYGLVRLRRSAAAGQAGAGAAGAARSWRVYRQFLMLTLLNPLTIVYFGSLILGGAGGSLNGIASRAVFVAGAALASLSWQSLLAGLGAFARRQLPPRACVLLSLAGNLIVIGFGIAVLAQLAR